MPCARRQKTRAPSSRSSRRMSAGFKPSDGTMLEADLQLAGGSSIFFDAVAVIVSETGARELVREAAALDFVSDAFSHLKVIGYVPAAEPLLRRVGITAEKIGK